MGSQDLANLIRRVVSNRRSSASEKVRLLQEGAAKINGIVFDPVPGIPGAQAVFKGAPRASDGKSPLLVVLRDGRMFRGFDDALIPDPSGKTAGPRLLMNRLKEL